MTLKLHFRLLSLRTIIGLLLSLLILSIFAINYMCPDVTCSRRNVTLFLGYQRYYNSYIYNNVPTFYSPYSISIEHPMKNFSKVGASRVENTVSFDNMIRNASSAFDIRANDLLVFLHIQKTGGTSLGHHLVRDLNLEAPCKCKKGRKRCKCTRPNSKMNIWLFSRYTTGWRCGVHADWTELVSCVQRFMDQTERHIPGTTGSGLPTTKRRYFYMTLLREPVARFLSEFRHIQRGATWKKSIHLCNGRVPTKEELPHCYSGSNWSNVTLDEFASCPHNLAFNRQTRMLADLTLVNCYNRTGMDPKTRDHILLESAKRNLAEMAYFGICEYQKMSQYLFESTFKLHFLHPFIQLNETHSSLYISELDAPMIQRIKLLNHLDIQLYEYAKQLLFSRFVKMKRLDKDFEYNYSHLGTLYNNSISAPGVQQEISPEIRIMRKVKKLKEEQLKRKSSFSPQR